MPGWFHIYIKFRKLVSVAISRIRCAKHHQMSQLAWWLAWLLWHFCSYLVMWVCTSHTQHQIESLWSVTGELEYSWTTQHQIESLWSVTGELEYSWTLPFCTSIPSNHHSQKSLSKFKMSWNQQNNDMWSKISSISGSFGVWIQRVLQHHPQGGCSIPLFVWQTFNSGPTQGVFKKWNKQKL